MNRPSSPDIIVALDVNAASEAQQLVDQLRGEVRAFKLGLEFYHGLLSNLLMGTWQRAEIELREARALYQAMQDGYFDDAKLCDIPNTVGQAAKQIARRRPWALNVHASSGSKAVAAVVANKGDSLVLGVTVLTSLKDECASIFGTVPGPKVRQFAEMLVDQGADGVICSAQEAEMIRNNEKTSGLLLVTPGIRPEWYPAQDQARPVTPTDAASFGIDYMVIGRPITKPPQEIGTPLDAVRRIRQETEAALMPAA